MRFLSFITKKDPNIWVFGAWYGKKYSDNPKAIYEYIANFEPNKRAIWISKDRRIVNSIRSSGLEVYKFNSIKGMFFQMKASKVFITHSLSADLMPGCYSKNTVVYLTYHGIALKKIMYDTYNGKNIYHKAKFSLKKLIKKTIDWQTYILATSKENQKIMSRAYNHSINKVIITGLPRNDVFINKKNTKNTYKVIFLPTFRDSNKAYDYFFQHGFNPSYISEKFSAHGIELHIKLHPLSTFLPKVESALQKQDNIKVLPNIDLYEKLPEYNCLITDYSSVLFDFLLTGKPILFSQFDYAQYSIYERGLYYKNLCIGERFTRWEELIDRLIFYKSNGLPKDYIDEYESIKQRFHSIDPTQLNRDKTSYTKIVVDHAKAH
ncbi:MAG: CDP-glycerol glycerophosphotransferase family protein [Bacteroidia bacterium]|nr:CDP-glycerol glycerophosphotransferase family protein [Bacteroidia bacterium]